MKTDRILQAMSNVALALHVLFESADDESFWKPYLGKSTDGLHNVMIVNKFIIS